MANFEELVPELYRTAGASLAAYGFALTGSRSEAEDLVQDAVVKTFVRHRRMEDVSHAVGYVRATMRTMYIDSLRREATWRRLVVRVAPPASSIDTHDVESLDVIERAIAELPPRVRTVVALRLYDDLTIGAIATAMRIAEGTVKKYLQEARTRLAALADVETEDDPAYQTSIAVVTRRSH